MTRSLGAVVCSSLAVVLCVASGRSLAGQAAGGARSSTALTGGTALANAYDLILDARFDRARTELQQADGAPPEARDVLGATALWWQIQLDPQATALDASFLRAVDASIAHAEAWTTREATRAEAWFYLGGAYAARVQWRVLRKERLAAARDGRRIKEALERAIALDPALDDAYFGLGLYLYYADVAPAGAKFLRWLLLLPGGDRRKGLELMLRARERGRLLRGEADYQLHLVFLWYEKQHGKALDLLETLHARYRGNPLFPLQIAEVQDTYFHDVSASLRTYRALLEDARRQRLNFAEQAEVQARLGMARQFEALFETDRAIEQLKLVIAGTPTAPFAALPRAYCALGAAHDRLGQRSQAVEAYRAALAAVPAADPYRIAEAAQRGIRHAPDPIAAAGYRASLEGWRALERDALDEAQAALGRAVELRPADPVARYRYGRLLDARHDEVGALAAFERVIGARPAAPPTILAAAYLEAARVLERAGARDRAIQMYERAATVWGAAEDTRAAATRSLARLRGASNARAMMRATAWGASCDENF